MEIGPIVEWLADFTTSGPDVTAFLQTDLFLAYHFFCERKAVPVQSRSDVKLAFLPLVKALPGEPHSTEWQAVTGM